MANERLSDTELRLRREALAVLWCILACVTDTRFVMSAAMAFAAWHFYKRFDYRND